MSHIVPDLDLLVAAAAAGRKEGSLLVVLRCCCLVAVGRTVGVDIVVAVVLDAADKGVAGPGDRRVCRGRRMGRWGSWGVVAVVHVVVMVVVVVHHRCHSLAAGLVVGSGVVVVVDTVVGLGPGLTRSCWACRRYCWVRRMSHHLPVGCKSMVALCPCSRLRRKKWTCSHSCSVGTGDVMLVLQKYIEKK